MTRRLVLRDDFFAELDARYDWYRTHRTAELAARFYDAALRRADSLMFMPESFALCLDPKVQGLGLREARFGTGKTESHRLIFRVDPVKVEVLTLRGLAQRDLTPRDL